MLIATILVVSLLASSCKASFLSTLKSKFARKPKTPARVANMPVAPSLPRHNIKAVWGTGKDFHNGLESASLDDRVLLLPQGVLYHSHIEPERTTHPAGQPAIKREENVSDKLIYRSYNGEERVVWENVPFGLKAIGASDDTSVITFYHAGKLHIKNKDNVRELVMEGPIKKLKLSADGNTLALETQSGDTLIRSTSDVLTKSHVDLPTCTKCRFDLAMDKALCLCTTPPKGTHSSTLTLHNLNAQSERVLKHFVPESDFEGRNAPVSWLVAPDGKHALISTSDARIHLYDMASGTLKSHTVTAASGKVKLKSFSSALRFLFTLEVFDKSTGAKELTVWRGDFDKAAIERLHIPKTGERVGSKLNFDSIEPKHVVQRTVQYGSLPIHVRLTVFEVVKAEGRHK